MEHIIIAPKAEEPAPTTEDPKPETPTAEERLAALEKRLAALEKRLADLEEQLKTKDEPAAEESEPEAPKEDAPDVAGLKATIAAQDAKLKALMADVSALKGTDIRADLAGDPAEEDEKPAGEDSLDTLAKMTSPTERSAFVAAHAEDLLRDAFRRRGR